MAIGSRSYVEPAWDAPLDGDTYLRAVPASATIKGMFPGAILAEAKRRNVTLSTAADKYLPFLDYLLTEHLRVALEAAPIFWPGMSLRQSLRKMGRAAMGAFTNTTIGKTVLAGLLTPEGMPHALRSIARAYAVSLSRPTPQVEVIEEGESSCILRMHDFWPFLDSHQVGIIEGLCKLCGVKGDVRIWTESLSSGEFQVTWRPRGPDVT